MKRKDKVANLRHKGSCGGVLVCTTENQMYCISLQSDDIMVEKGMPERLEVKRTFRRLTGYLS
jgi:hypothetical protein